MVVVHGTSNGPATDGNGGQWWRAAIRAGITGHGEPYAMAVPEVGRGGGASGPATGGDGSNGGTGGTATSPDDSAFSRATVGEGARCRGATAAAMACNHRHCQGRAVDAEDPTGVSREWRCHHWLGQRW